MTATPPDMPRVPGYTISRHLARGGMAEVYVAEQIALQRPVALKILRMAEAGGADAVERFEQETRLIAELSHPNIVGIHDVGHSSDGALYYAMPFLPGGDLTARASPLPPAEIRKLLAALLDALRYAHGKGIVHRDIKPANVIFDPSTLDTKITDFGIARLTNSSATRTGIVLGTPSFMAPEQLEGRNVNGRSDLFSLGVTLFQLLAGQLPFRADSMTGLMDKIANAPHPPLRTIRPDLPPCVGLIVDRALQKDPARRFATAAEMARALRACARSLAAA